MGLRKCPPTHFSFASLLPAFRNLRSHAVTRRRRARRWQPTCALAHIEALEDRTLLSSFTTQSLSGLSVSGTTEHKPQSKVWEQNNTWFAATNTTAGMRISRLDGTQWKSLLTISGANGWSDVKSLGDKAYVLIQNGSSSKLATLQYSPGSPGTYSLAAVSDLPSLGNFEVLTIDIDSTGRMWMAYDSSGAIYARYADAPYATNNWSSPITIATGAKSDDIAMVVALPNRTVGVLWSNQNAKLFGFRTHVDGANPNSWSADEKPASQSALNVGGGMADDHLNAAVASDGTLYVAVKTSYDNSNQPTIGLLVRRPNGTWDDFHTVAVNRGTRPIVVLNEALGRVYVMYDESGIKYRESTTSVISFEPEKSVMSGSNVTSTKQSWTDDLVVIAGSNSVRLVAATSQQNTAPAVNAGSDQTILITGSAGLNGTVSDDGLPNPPGKVTTAWSKVSGPGTVSFGNTSSLSTTAAFSQTGTYVLRLTANDGELTAADDLTVTVNDSSSGSGQTIAFQDGAFPTGSYKGTRDTKIRSDQPNNKFGSNKKLELDGNPDFASLVQWDLTSIAAGSQVTAASITINVVNTSKDTFEIYRLLRPWSEGETTFNQSTSGTPWQVSGASGATDRGSTVLGEITAPALGLATINLNAAGVAVVQSWIDNPGSNYGFIFQDYADASTDDLDFDSREATTAGNRPKLTISFGDGGSGGSTDPSPTNTAPAVNAGPDQTILITGSASLNGTVSDDGLPNPPGKVTTTWSKVSGPSTVSFGNTSSLSTTAAFSQTGTYVLRLTANDGELTAADDLTVIVNDSSSGSGQTISFQDGAFPTGSYKGTRDTKIRSDQPNNKFGSNKKLELDGNPDFASLVQWDLTSVAAGSQVTAASITINVVNTSKDTFEIYQLLRPWSEGETTFNHSTSGTPWQVSGASGATDRGSTVLGEITAPALGLVTINLNAAGVAVVQSWIDNPGSNYGFIFQDYADASTDDLDFDSREATTAGNRPKLTATLGGGSGSLLAASPAPRETAAALTEEQLAPFIVEAANRWLAATDPLDRDQAAALLGSVTFAIADLPGGQLGAAIPGGILIDANAAGWGWFIDATPDDDREFRYDRSGDQLVLRGNVTDGGMDLLTVVLHELGHLLGHDHDSSLLMEDTLPTNTRRLPTTTTDSHTLAAIDSYFLEFTEP